MRILLCGGRDLTDSTKNIEYGFRSAGHEVLHIPTRSSKREGRPLANIEELICYSWGCFEPDILFWSNCKYDYKYGLAKMMRSCAGGQIVPKIYHTIDDPFEMDKNDDAATIASEFDLAVTCCKGSVAKYREIGTPAICLYPPPHDLLHFRSGRVDDERCDISLACSNLYPKAEYPEVLMGRAEIVEAVAGLGTLNIYGPNDKFPREWFGVGGLPQTTFRGWRAAEELPHIYKTSKINLNSHVRPDGYRYLNERVINCLAAGGFMLTDHVNGIEELFKPGVHLDTWKTKEELQDKIQYWLTHDPERQAVARRGQERVRLEYTGNRFSEMLEEFIKANK